MVEQIESPQKTILFINQHDINSIKIGLTVAVLILLLIIVSSGGLSGVGSWFAAIFAIIFTSAHLGLTYYSHHISL